MRRRSLLAAAACALILRADDAQDVWSVLGDAASALSEDSVAIFMSCFDPKMPGYDKLRADVTGLIQQAALHSSVEPEENTGDDKARVVEVTWTMNMVDRADSASSVRREARLTFHLEKQGKRWKITSCSPANFFAPQGPK